MKRLWQWLFGPRSLEMTMSQAWLDQQKRVKIFTW